jgi:hypothetical protein
MSILSTKKDEELVTPINTIPDPNDPALTTYDTQMSAALAEEQKHNSQVSKELENLKNDTMASIDSNQAKQEELVQSGLELQEQKLNNEIAKAEKSMRAEKADAYADYQKEIDPYGVNAEHRASQGLNRSGYSESAKVAAFTAHQNRVATARAAFEQAKTEYNIAMEEAKQSANVELANIYANSLQQKLTAAMQFFSMNDSIFNNSLANRISIENHYSTLKDNEWEKLYKKLAAEEEARRWNLNFIEEQKTNDILREGYQKENAKLDLETEILQKEKEQLGSASIQQNTNQTGNGVVYSFDEYTDNPNLTVNTDDLVNMGLGDVDVETLQAYLDSGSILMYEENGVRRFCSPDSDIGKKVLTKRLEELKNKGNAREYAIFLQKKVPLKNGKEKTYAEILGINTKTQKYEKQEDGTTEQRQAKNNAWIKAQEEKEYKQWLNGTGTVPNKEVLERRKEEIEAIPIFQRSEAEKREYIKIIVALDYNKN